MLIKNKKLLKITKVRHFRINFRYENKLYTLNEYENGYESVVGLRERESGKSLVSSYMSLNVGSYIKPKLDRRFKDFNNIVYREVDLDYFIIMLNKFIEDNKNS